jgi:TPR repeat protein
MELQSRKPAFYLEHDTMRLFWKIATPVFCVAIIGSAGIYWQVYKAKAKLADAARACRVSAEQGDTKSEFDLAHMYYSGRGVPQNYAEAFRWCRKAAEQGDAKAEYDLAHLYLKAEGVSQDYDEALRWYRKSADQGDPMAEYGVGFMYHDGLGVPQDYAEADRWYRKSADHGNAIAQYELGYMYYYGKGVQQDNAESARWYRKAADQGYAKAESGIGFMLWYGYGVTQDRAEADRWFRKAADQGDEYALRTLSKSLSICEKFTLIIQLIGGFILSTSFLSLNIFEAGKGLRSFRQKVICGTGILILLSTGLSWYGYTHYKIRCIFCGINTFTVLKWIFNLVIICLLIYIVRSKEPEAQESEIVAEEVESGSEDNK